MHASQSTTPTITPPPIPAAAPLNDDPSPVHDALDEASPLDPTNINLAPHSSSSPASEVLNEVQMAEPPQPNGQDAHNDVPVASSLGLDLADDAHMAEPEDVKPNGVHINGDAPTPSVEHLALQTPELNIPMASPSDSTAATRPAPDDGDDDDQPPPTKRARILSAADQASINHVSTPVFVHRITLTLFALKGKWHQRYKSRPPSTYTSLPHPSPYYFQPTTI